MNEPLRAPTVQSPDRSCGPGSSCFVAALELAAAWEARAARWRELDPGAAEALELAALELRSLIASADCVPIGAGDGSGEIAATSTTPTNQDSIRWVPTI